jgi:hypothetical protein
MSPDEGDDDVDDDNVDDDNVDDNSGRRQRCVPSTMTNAGDIILPIEEVTTKLPCKTSTV